MSTTTDDQSIHKIEDFAAQVTGSEFMPRAQAQSALPQILKACRGKNVVLSGAGGGADCYGVAWLLPQLQQKDGGAKSIAIANLGFVSTRVLKETGTEVIRNLCYKVPPGLTLDANDYYAEARLATALSFPVYSFHGGECTVGEIAQCHASIVADAFYGGDVAAAVENRKENVLFLVDGGCDILLEGSETGLATPIEDMLHLAGVLYSGSSAAASAPTNKQSIYATSFICNIGANIDVAHGVVETEMVDRIKNLSKIPGCLLYADVLTPENEFARFYCEVVSRCMPVFTIVQSMAVAAIEGHRGKFTPEHLKRRIGRNKVALNDRTATFFIFDLNKINIGYLASMKPECEAGMLQQLIAAYRS